MDTGEMVEQLVEKRLQDYIESSLEAAGDNLLHQGMQSAMTTIISEVMNRRFEQQKPALLKRVEDFLDSVDYALEKLTSIKNTAGVVDIMADLQFVADWNLPN